MIRRTTISPGITFIEPPPGKGLDTCAGVLLEGRRRVLIDGNMGPRHSAAFLKSLRPDAVIISHYHIDHSALAGAVAADGNAELFFPELSASYLQDIAHFYQLIGDLPQMMPLWKRYIDSSSYTTVEQFTTYGPGSTIAGVPGGVEIQTARGHSPDHSVFYFPEDKILFVVDVGIDGFGPWYGWQDCDLAELVETLLRLRGLSVSVLLTSHGGLLSEDIKLAFDRCLRIILRREKLIRDQLAAGVDDDTIAANGIQYRTPQNIREPIRTLARFWDGIALGHHRKVLAGGGLEQLFPELAGIRSRD